MAVSWRQRGSLTGALLAVSLIATPAFAQLQYTFYETYPATAPGAGPFNGGAVICSGVTGSGTTGFQLDFNDAAVRQMLCPSNPGRFVPAEGDSWGARFTGVLTAPSAGQYSLTVDADDGDQLVVNGQVVRTDWIVKGSGPGAVGSIALLQGANDFILNYFQGPAVGGYIDLAIGGGLTVTPPPTTPSTVPEPGALALVSTGLLGLAGITRRVRRPG